MKIEQLAVVFPTKVVTNDMVIEMIHRESKNFEGDLEKTLKQLRRALHRSGGRTRRWLNIGETSRELAAKACRKAMDGLGGDNDIDLLISASVYPELVEPSTANLIAQAIGLPNVECFDVKEACDGWMKAVKIASALIATGEYRRIMVVNSEFVMTPGFGIYPELFKLNSMAELEWRFPAYTLGEGASAMILGPDPSNVWEFSNTSRNDLFDLCSITMPWHEKDSGSSHRLAKDGSGLFTSYGADLRHHGFPLAVDEFKKSGIEPAKVDKFFTHSSSKKDWSEVAEVLGLVEQFYDLYARHGNVVSAAVPAAMALAHEEGFLKRGDRVVALVASAGMSFSLASFTF